MQQERTKFILGTVVFVGSLVLYLLTVAPTVSFWDTGEFIATAYTMGVPHPPGSPLFILLGRIFSLLPTASDPALRMNIMSPLAAAGANLLTFLIIVQLVRIWRDGLDNSSDKLVAYAGGFIGALTFAMTDSHWFNSVESEVYAISTFATALVVWMIFKWAEQADEPGHERYLLGIAYVMGLAIGVHLLNLLALPVIALVIYYRKYQFQWSTFFVTVGATLVAFLTIYLGVIKGLPKVMSVQYLGGNVGFWLVGLLVFAVFGLTWWSIRARRNLVAVTGMALVLILVGYSSYTMIYIRANQDPTINENDPSTPARFVSYLEREQYGQHSILDRAGTWQQSQQDPGAYIAPRTGSALEFVWEYQIKYMYLRYFHWQFLGRVGDQIAPFQYFMLPFLLGLFGMVHHFQRDGKRAFIVLALFIMTGLAIVAYLNQPDPQPRERDYSYVGSFMAFSLWIGLGASGLLELIQDTVKKRNQRLVNGLSYGLVALLILAVPIQMLAKNYYTHDRSGNYVAWDYSYNILQTVAPNGIVITNGDNDTFPLWYLQEVEKVRTDVRIVNLSLLNTHWYIKQLRDYEPTILPESLSDAAIDQLYPMQFNGQDVEISVPESEQNPDGSIRFYLEPPYQGSYIRVQDIMVLRILQENLGKRPVYFALTVPDYNKVSLDSFLVQEGIAEQVMPYRPDEFLDPEQTRHNLFEEYQYRNFNNPDVYFNVMTLGLLQNIRSVFSQLAFYYYQRGQAEQIVQVLEKMDEVVPEEVIPYQGDMDYLQIGRLYAEAGRTDVLKERLDRMLSEPDATMQQKINYGQWYIQYFDDLAPAESLFTDLYAQDPNNGQIAANLVRIYELRGKWDPAYNVLNQWLETHPGDSQARQLLQRFKQQLDAADTSGSVE